jgi:hypothetical protein
MSDLDDALAALERAVSRLEAAPVLSHGDALAQLTAEHDAENRQVESTAAEIVARVEAALAKINQVLDGDG